MDHIASDTGDAETLDVLVIGAGISGIGVASRLQQDRPGTSFVVLEAREAAGGTWDLFRYPGVRSDSDLYTFGFDFKPWRDERSIAPARKILDYLEETVDENGLRGAIRYGHRVVSAAWSSTTATWTVTAAHAGDTVSFTCRWLVSATGYYDYENGYTPTFRGSERFGGRIVHPQHWPADLDYSGKHVVIIGSGATALTLAPAMAGEAAHVTVLQRTPSYIQSIPSVDVLAEKLKALLGEERAYPWIRRKNIWIQRLTWQFCRRHPRLARSYLRRATARQLPAGYPVDLHFNPPYDPWDQRLCLVPNGDFFKAIRRGAVSMATDRIDTFTEAGIELESGQTLEADIVVTATGLTLLPFGGIPLSVDGESVSLPATVAYKGVMLSGVPNFSYSIGYTNMSWTLKVGLLGRYLCRLLAFMEAHQVDTCVPAFDGLLEETRPLLDLAAGYVERSVENLPRQGARPPWTTSTGFHPDEELLVRSAIADEHLQFSSRRSAPAGPPSDPATANPAEVTHT